MNHCIYQKLNVLDCHPSQYLEEASGRTLLSGNYTPYQLAEVLLFYFHPSFGRVSQLLHFQPLL